MRLRSRRTARRHRVFFFNDTATTEIYTLSLHDALPISHSQLRAGPDAGNPGPARLAHEGRQVKTAADLHWRPGARFHGNRSEEHTSELQSRPHLVCRLLLEKKKKMKR